MKLQRIDDLWGKAKHCSKNIRCTGQSDIQLRITNTDHFKKGFECTDPIEPKEEKLIKSMLPSTDLLLRPCNLVGTGDLLKSDVRQTICLHTI